MSSGGGTGLSRLHSLEFYKRKREWILERERFPSPEASFDYTTTIEPTVSKLSSPNNWRHNDSSSSNSRMSTDDQSTTRGKKKERGRNMRRRSDQIYCSDLNRTYSLDGETTEQESAAWDSSVGSMVLHIPVSLARSRSTSMLDSDVLSASFLHRSLEDPTDEATFARQAALRPHSSQISLARNARATYASIAAQMKKDLESIDLKPPANHKHMARSTSASEILSVHASTNSDSNENNVTDYGNAVGKHHFIWNIRDRNANNKKLNVQAKPFRYSKEALYMLNKNYETPKSSDNVCDNPDESDSELKTHDELFEFFTPIPGLELNAIQYTKYDAGNLEHMGNNGRIPNQIEKMAWVGDEYDLASNNVNWENDKTYSFAIPNYVQSNGEHRQMQEETGFCNNYENISTPPVFDLKARQHTKYDAGNLDHMGNDWQIPNLVNKMAQASDEYDMTSNNVNWNNDKTCSFAVPNNLQPNGEHCQMLQVENGFCNNYKNTPTRPGFTHLRMYDRHVANVSHNAEKISNLNFQDQNGATQYQEFNTPYNSQEYLDEYFDPYDRFPTTVDRNHPEFYQANINKGYGSAYDSIRIREEVLKKITVQYGGKEISFIDEYTDRNIESVAPRIDMQNDRNWMQNQNLPHMHQAFPNQAQHWPNQRFEPGLGRGRGMRAWSNTPEPGRKEVYP